MGDILSGLIKSKFKLNLSSITDQNIINKIAEECGKDWISPSGDIYLAKVNIKGKIRYIKAERDFAKYGIENYKDFISSNPNSIELNPALEKYNYLNYFIT
jgi:hypothetical protein